MSVKKALLLLALAFALAPLSVLADTLDFQIIATSSNTLGGTISYAGGASPLVGTNIVVDSVVDKTTGVTYDLGDGPGTQPGVLSFTTGASTGGWNFGPGGSITITAGCIDSDRDDADFCAPLDDTVASGALGTGGVFLKGTVSSATVLGNGGTFNVSVVMGNDQKDVNLLSLFGITPPPSWSAGANVSFEIAAPGVAQGSAFTSSSLDSGDVANSPVVPEPGSLLLLGSGLLGLGGVIRRRIFGV